MHQFRPLQNEAEAVRAFEIIAVAFSVKALEKAKGWVDEKFRKKQMFGFFAQDALAVTLSLNPEIGDGEYELNFLARAKEFKGHTIESMTLARRAVLEACDYIQRKDPRSRKLCLTANGTFLQSYYKDLGFKLNPIDTDGLMERVFTR